MTPAILLAVGRYQLNALRRNRLQNTFSEVGSDLIVKGQNYLPAEFDLEFKAIVSGAIITATTAIESIQPFDELWGPFGSEEKARSLARVFSLNLVSIWLTRGGDLSLEQAKRYRQYGAEQVLRMFEFYSDNNLQQFLLRDTQAQFELNALKTGSNRPLVAIHQLASDILRAFGWKLNEKLIYLPRVPLESARDIEISRSFSSKLNLMHLLSLYDVTITCRAVCDEVLSEQIGPLADDLDAFDDSSRSLSFPDDGEGHVYQRGNRADGWSMVGPARGVLGVTPGYEIAWVQELSLEGALKRLDNSVDLGGMKEILPSLVLVPLEHEIIRNLACPACQTRSALRQLSQQALVNHPDPSVWPYSSPPGDLLTVRCEACSFILHVTFWFTK